MIRNYKNGNNNGSFIKESDNFERIHAHKTTGGKTGHQQPHYIMAKRRRSKNMIVCHFVSAACLECTSTEQHDNLFNCKANCSAYAPLPP